MRDIRFRAWDKDHNRMIGGEWLEIRHDDVAVLNEEGDYSFGFSGFIDEYEVIGNIYENKELLK